MKYINIFNTSGDVQTALNEQDLLKPYLAYISGSNSYDFNTLNPQAIDYSTIPFTIIVLSDGYLYLPKNIRYQKNDETPVDLDDKTTIPVNRGDKIVCTYYKFLDSFMGNTFQGTTCRFEVYGNIMSLVYDNNSFSAATTFPSGTWYMFFGLFNGCSGLIDAENLILPVTELASGCYSQMFYNCYSLTTAPALPASTLAQQCYQMMFGGCSSLIYIKCLATDLSATNCTGDWISNVSATGTFVKASGADWSSKTGNDGIPSGWTIEEE